jgi:two-component system OmpR family sensor kinase
VWWVINRSLAPVERARRELALRAADDFSPLASRDLPDEVRPLVRELNLLFGRVRQAFDAQKNFVADAAHELRSPLTALKLQAQALRRRSSDPADLETAVARLNQGIDRTIHLVEQLLVLAREEAASADVNAQPEQVDLSDILRQAIADVLPQATARNIDLGVCEPLPAQPLPVRGQSEALRRMLRNLLDNAVKYSPPGSRVDIRLALETAADGRAICLMELRDSGPGIAEEDRVRVFDRFYRASDVNLPDGAPSGSGLGLAIVEVVARRHGVAVTLGTSAGQGGLRVLLRFTLTAGAV